MEAQLEQIREQQKQTWNKFSPGWRKWDDFTMNFLKPMGDEIIRHLDLQPNDRVLDIAAGTGEPGLTIAVIVRNGHVVITDLAEGMLEVARDNARKKGITNIETVACDVSELPFADNSFDAVSCRFGFMFFPDMAMAAREMVRVLKPGGKLATSVWSGAPKNPWITSTMGSLNKHMQLPPPAPGAPGMFRCAEPGLIAGLFRQAGLKNVEEKEIPGKVPFGTNENYWEFMNEVVAPVVAAMSQADSVTKLKIQSEVFDTLNQKYPDNKVNVDYASIVIWGEK